MTTLPEMTPVHSPSNPDLELPAVRRIVHRTRGAGHGGIVRLMSPSDLGQLLKPFIFLDIFSSPEGSPMGVFPMHPHSGIATLTYMIEGEASYEDTTGDTGKKGILPAGGVEWMMAGGGVWHTGSPANSKRMLGLQLWVAMPPELENAPALSVYQSPDELTSEGPALVLLGRYGSAVSAIRAPTAINYLAVHLKAGEAWRYVPPEGHTVAWIALSRGLVAAPTDVNAGELVIFEESIQPIEFHAKTDCVFVLGSAAKHPHELFMGSYSVHTSAKALALGEAGIRLKSKSLRAKVR